MSVQLELKLPTKGPKGLEWAQSDYVHPYWFIKRTEMDESEANAKLIGQQLNLVSRALSKRCPQQALKSVLQRTCSM